MASGDPLGCSVRGVAVGVAGNGPDLYSSPGASWQDQVPLALWRPLVGALALGAHELGAGGRPGPCPGWWLRKDSSGSICDQMTLISYLSMAKDSLAHLGNIQMIKAPPSL